MSVKLTTTQDTVKILVDASTWQPTHIRPGTWRVADLKAAVGVPAHKVLARIDPFGLTALGDEETTEIEEDMRFMSHVRPGVSI